MFSKIQQREIVPDPIYRRDRDMALTAKQVERFHQDGFLVIEELMPLSEVVGVYRSLNRLFDARIGFDQGMFFDFLSSGDDPDKPVMPQILRPSLHAPALLRGTAARRAANIARQLLGPKAKLSFDHVLIKPPFSDAATPWHQDDAFANPNFHSHSISFWVPLQAVDRDNGCLCFIPGSSTRTVLPHRSPNDDGRIHALECDPGTEVVASTACPIPAGGCTIHSGRTLHSAGSNLSDKARYAFIMVFSTPKRLAKVIEPRPWMKMKQTARIQRERRWRRRGGWIIHAWRCLPESLLRVRHHLRRAFLRHTT